MKIKLFRIFKGLKGVQIFKLLTLCTKYFETVGFGLTFKQGNLFNKVSEFLAVL